MFPPNSPCTLYLRAGILNGLLEEMETHVRMFAPTDKAALTDARSQLVAHIGGGMPYDLSRVGEPIILGTTVGLIFVVQSEQYYVVAEMDPAKTKAKNDAAKRQ